MVHAKCCAPYPKQPCVRHEISVMGHLNTNNFYFIFFYFSNFTLLYFSFLLKDNEEGM